MTGASLTTEMLVAAVMRAAEADGLPAVLEKRGDANRGAIIVRINRYDIDAGTAFHTNTAQCRIETRQFDPSNRYVWQPLLGKNGEAWMGAAEADALISRQVRYDPDCWVVAFDDTTGDNDNPFVRLADIAV